MSSFKQAINEAMLRLAALPRAVFVGQSVKYDGAAIYDSLAGVPDSQRIEFPVVENLQLGYCAGLSLAGQLPICIFPRIDFMLLAMDQLVNHLDKLPLYGWRPKVIIRTTVGQKVPLDAGPQHTQNHCEAFRRMLKTIQVFEVRTLDDISFAYNRAQWDSERSILVVENPL
jgi:pyruvate/2-oxoglutarate/acetoin dehydrogenase E1 component